MLVVNGPGKVLGEVVDDPLDRKHADRLTQLIDHGQVPIAPSSMRRTARPMGSLRRTHTGSGVMKSDTGRSSGTRAASTCRIRSRSVKMADKLGTTADEEAAHFLLAHERDRLRDRLRRLHLPRRRGVQAGDALDLQVPRQVHRPVSPSGGGSGGWGGGWFSRLSLASSPKGPLLIKIALATLAGRKKPGVCSVLPQAAGRPCRPSLCALASALNVILHKP